MCPSDALVFFGGTGDLAYKKVVPALQGMVCHGSLDVPVIAVVARAGWRCDQLLDRARVSLSEYGGGVDEAEFDRLARRLEYIDGDYGDPATFARLRSALGDARCPAHYLAKVQITMAECLGMHPSAQAAHNGAAIGDAPGGAARRASKGPAFDCPG